jgi:hypothetical protein
MESLLLRRFDGYKWQLAVANVVSADLRELSVVRGCQLTLQHRTVHGWYARLDTHLLGLAVSHGEPYLISPGSVLAVTDDVEALLVKGPIANTLTIRRDGEALDVITYRPPQPPRAARLDPTFDEDEEDRDFGLWLSHTVSRRQRIDTLLDHFSSTP